MNWDRYYLGIAEAVAARSKDESTKLGAVIADSRGVLSTGYNSFPRGVFDDVAERQERPLKYKWFVHAEANAIYNAARVGISLENSVIYCRWRPCPSCAQAIIQAGIVRVVVASLDVPDRWLGDMELASSMLSEAGVTMETAC